mgnify:CR=1 FL=1
MTPEQRKHFEFVRDEMHGKPKQEQGEPVACNIQMDECSSQPEQAPRCMTCGKWTDKPCRNTTPQQRKPLMLEKFREMEALLDNSNAPQHKTITDDELKIIMETTMPVIDWKTRYGVELNNGERNKWMLEWFIAFARAIEAAHGIKE